MSTHQCPDCQACSGLTDSTPIDITNRPGLAAIAYRTGSYSRFQASMLAGLSRGSRPALSALKTREADDFSIALIDAWAVSSEVLTFYTERIANEHYLGTATERRSVADLAALLGYRLDPGVAAQTVLAISLETAPGAPAESAIPAGTRMQTIAGPGEVPQTFETIETLTALGAWNRPLPELLAPRIPRTGDTEVILAGVALTLRRGDRLLFVSNDWTSASTRWQMVRVVGMTPEPAANTTVVAFSPALTGLDLTNSSVSLHVMRGQAAFFGYNAPNPRLFESAILTALKSGVPALVDASNEWMFTDVTGQEVLLDGLYDGVEPGGWAVLTAGSDTVLAPVDAVRETAASAYALSARVSALQLARTDTDLAGFGGPETRTTIVSFRSEELSLAEVRLTAPLTGASIPLAVDVPGVQEPRRMLVRGSRTRAVQGSGSLVDGAWPADPAPIVVSIETEGLSGLVRWTLRPASGDDVSLLGPPDALIYLPAKPDDEIVGEVVSVAATPPGPVSILSLIEPLANVYDLIGPTPVDLFGNIADATHGERVAGEVLGSGDGTRAFQRFALRKRPLTYVQAQTPTGGESTLEVWINSILWHEEPTLFAAGPRDRVFTTASDDTGTTTITFGDGVTGARLPSGLDNVIASYRAGLGLAGAARAEQISLAMTRPLGLKSVTNPLPAGGAQDAQSTEDARTNAPRSVLTLGRVVALADYADFSADFSGVAKAAAIWTWDGARRGVLVTVAATNGQPLPAGVPLLENLRTGILAVSNPRVRLELRDFRPAGFAVLAFLRIASDHDPEIVRAAVTLQLLQRYSFNHRTFGQGVSLSEVVESIHAVHGVEAVRIERLHREDQPAQLATFLVAAAPQAGGPPGSIGAEILSLAAAGIMLEVGW